MRFLAFGNGIIYPLPLLYVWFEKKECESVSEGKWIPGFCYRGSLSGNKYSFQRIQPFLFFLYFVIINQLLCFLNACRTQPSPFFPMFRDSVRHLILADSSLSSSTIVVYPRSTEVELCMDGWKGKQEWCVILYYTVIRCNCIVLITFFFK